LNPDDRAKADQTPTHEPLVASDSAVQRRHREHQGWWRREVLGLPAGRPSPQVRRRYPTLGNYLPESHRGLTAAEAGWNLMSPQAHAYTQRRLTVLARTDGLAETDRLWRNMLSSQPLAFSIAGQLRAFPEAAAGVFAELTGLPVAALDRLGDPDDDYLLDGIEAEWSPPRDHHTGDRSGFDIAALLRLEDDSRLLVSIETKYIDSFSRARLDPERYRRHLEAIGLSPRAVEAIVERGASQFLRSVLLTDSVRRSGIRGEDRIDHQVAAVLARGEDTSADDAVEALADHLPKAGVARWSYGDLFAATAQRPDLAQWTREMKCRYTLPNLGSPSGMPK
jgi:hypothetical protein